MTPSQLSKMSASRMRSRIMAEMGIDIANPPPTQDEKLLADYFDFLCKQTPSRRRRDIEPTPIAMEDRAGRTKRAINSSDDVRLYGNTLTYECGLARRFLSNVSRTTYLHKNITCLWNKTWIPDNALEQCVWVACINPPAPPPESRMVSTWTGTPVNFTYNSSYICDAKDVFYEFDRREKEYNITCLNTGGWAAPYEWPACVPTVNCSEPPERPSSGTWQWDRSYEYNTTIIYTCGPYGQFQLPSGKLIKEVVSSCAWNKSWTPNTLPPCVAKSCPIIPFPPSYTGMVFVPDPKSQFNPVSEFRKYGQKMPSSLPFPGHEFCAGGNTVLSAIGKVTTERRGYTADIAILTKSGDEALHVKIALGDRTVYRYFTVGGKVMGLQGQSGDGTSIDLNEPFVIRIREEVMVI